RSMRCCRGVQTTTHGFIKVRLPLTHSLSAIMWMSTKLRKGGRSCSLIPEKEACLRANRSGRGHRYAPKIGLGAYSEHSGNERTKRPGNGRQTPPRGSMPALDIAGRGFERDLR